MTIKLPKPDPDAPILVCDIGNSTIKVATWQKNNLKAPLSINRNDEAELEKAIDAHTDAMPRQRPAAIVLVSVVPLALEEMRAYLGNRFEKDALVVGERIKLPLDLGVDDPRAVGGDRVCAAAAVYDRIETGCIVVDFGSAATIDLVDDEGTFVGGAILPGLKMQLAALHEHTATLPLVDPEFPDSAYGRNTAQAMQTGVCRGLAGAARGLVEAYATAINHWPQVVATGGDVELMAPHCDFIDTFATDLVLRGVGVAYDKHLRQAGF